MAQYSISRQYQYFSTVWYTISNDFHYQYHAILIWYGTITYLYYTIAKFWYKFVMIEYSTTILVQNYTLYINATITKKFQYSPKMNNRSFVVLNSLMRIIYLYDRDDIIQLYIYIRTHLRFEFLKVKNMCNSYYTNPFPLKFDYIFTLFHKVQFLQCYT